MMGIDDQILAHPKFVRAVRAGGWTVVAMWLGLRCYCAQKLTDGFIPEDMLDTEVRGPIGKVRAAAISALRATGLVHNPQERSACADCQSAKITGEAHEGLWMHDYLQWSDSRDDVLTRREANRDRQRKSRGLSQRDNANSTSDVTTPSPNLSKPIHKSPPNPLGPRELKLRSRPEAPTGNADADLKPIPIAETKALLALATKAAEG